MNAAIADEIEAERAELARELVAEFGEDWSLEFRPGTAGCHELVDRASMLADIVARNLATHPACVARPEWFCLAQQALTALQTLYQRAADEHVAADEAE